LKTNITIRCYDPDNGEPTKTLHDVVWWKQVALELHHKEGYVIKVFDHNHDLIYTLGV
jgi:hypothetical protein